MPAYEYELYDPQTGKVLLAVTCVRPVLARDQVKLRRRKVPGRIVISGSAANPDCAATDVLRGYHRQEEKLGSRFRSQFSADQVKRSLTLPPATLD